MANFFGNRALGRPKMGWKELIIIINVYAGEGMRM
jgi:hypothetical protein